MNPRLKLAALFNRLDRHHLKVGCVERRLDSLNIARIVLALLDILSMGSRKTASHTYRIHFSHGAMLLVRPRPRPPPVRLQTSRCVVPWQRAAGIVCCGSTPSCYCSVAPCGDAFFCGVRLLLSSHIRCIDVRYSPALVYVGWAPRPDREDGTPSSLLLFDTYHLAGPRLLAPSFVGQSTHPYVCPLSGLSWMAQARQICSLYRIETDIMDHTRTGRADLRRSPS